jgi:cell division septation protein DedD
MSRDQVSISQSSLLWVALMGVGLLTFAFVLGVQMGKQGAALRGPKVKSIDEELRELPEPLTDQLRALESADAEQRPAAEAKPEPKPEAKPKEEAKPAEEKSEHWTLQLVGTKDAAEAKRVADKAKAAGFKTTTVKEQGLNKVRLAKADSRAAIDKQLEKLKKAGFKPFPVKVD